jgi:glutathione S-transferase
VLALMIVVHHLENSRSHRILWLLEELHLHYEVKRYARDPVTMLAPQALRDVHRLGKSPVITDGAITLAESGAIIEYLVEKNPDAMLAPARGTAGWVRYIYWLHFAEGSAMPPLLLKLVFDRIELSAPWPIRPIAGAIARQAKRRIVEPRLVDNLDYMESELARSTWFAGEVFSAADIQMSFPVEASAQRAGLDARWPRLVGFLQRIRERPAFGRAVERGGGHAIVD